MKQTYSVNFSRLLIPIYLKQNLTWGKRAISVAAPMVWNKLPITLKLLLFSEKKLKTYSKLHFHHKCSVVPRSETDFCTSVFTNMLNHSVLLRL